jgi:IS4 transposase
VISIYQRRWPIEIIFKELKSALGLGEHQVSKEEKRIINSIGIAIISYLFLLISCKEHINRGQSWGIFNLQEKFRSKVMTNQIKHSMNLEIEKLQRAA